MTNYQEILRLYGQGISKNSIAKSCECSRNTATDVIRRAEEIGLDTTKSNSMTNEKLQKLLFPIKTEPSIQKMPDYAYVHKEMARSGVTLTLLWNEYCEACRMNGDIPFMYTQFWRYYHDYVTREKATMHIDRKPGEQMEVDWAGQTAHIINTDTGELIPAYLFVSVLPSSGYAYVEAFLSQEQESWIAAHVNAYKHFGGVTQILIPDNLKTGVDRVLWYTPVINRTYHEMAEHYGTAVIPARVRKPKDKATVEGTVGVVSTCILAALRNQQFFSLSELNDMIREKLFDFNRKPFQKKQGSRFSVFQEEEKAFLLPLPQRPYELAIWKIATVQYNYHIAVDKIYYSVPYEYIKHKVDVRLTKNVVEVFFQGNRICSHPRLHGREGQYSTVAEHMPEAHQKYLSWNAERFLSWAKNIGTNTEITVKAILSSHKVEQQGYRACMALLKLADKYSVARLETACQKALTYSPQPTFKTIKTVLESKLDLAKDDVPPNNSDSSEFGFTRGSRYYGGETK